MQDFLHIVVIDLIIMHIVYFYRCMIRQIYEIVESD